MTLYQLQRIFIFFNRGAPPSTQSRQLRLAATVRRDVRDVVAGVVYVRDDGERQHELEHDAPAADSDVGVDTVHRGARQSRRSAGLPHHQSNFFVILSVCYFLASISILAFWHFGI
jgi:hypothetical protein